MDRILVPLARALPLSLIAIAVLALLLLVLLWWLLRRRRKASESEEVAEGEGTAAAVLPLHGDLAASFRRADRDLREHHPRTEERYAVPWVLVLGAQGSRSEDLLSGADLPVAFARPEGGAATGCAFWFLHQGTVLELGGQHVLERDGRTLDERGFAAFLRLLERMRPERPLDGVVVTVPVADLLSADSDGGERLDEKAAHLNGRLLLLQERLGLRLPVHLLLTGGDELRGFGGFVEALAEQAAVAAPGERLQALPGLFGWANPHDRDRPFRPEWIATGFDTLRARLDAVQAELLAADQPPHRRDPLFLFPLAVRRLEEPLARFSRNLFQDSAYHAPLLFRGFFLTGQSAPRTAAHPRPSHFLRSVLLARAFPEAGLAEPLPDLLLSRHRRVRGLQCAVAVVMLALLLGTGFAYRALARRNTGLENFFTKVEQDLSRLGSAEHEKALARELLESMGQVDARPYRSVFLPPSWWGELNGRMVAGFRKAFEKIIVDALYLTLEKHAEGVLEEDPGYRPTVLMVTAPTGATAVPVPEATPEFAALATFVDRLVDLEADAREYNQLVAPGTGEQGGVARLVQELLEIQIPRSFHGNAALYERALRGVAGRPFELSRYHGAASQRAGHRVTAFYHRLFRESPLIEALTFLRDALEPGPGADPEGAVSLESVEGLAELVRRLERVSDVLESPGVDWMFARRFGLGAEFERLVAALAASELVGPGITQRVREAGESNFAVAQRSLATLGTEATGLFLAQDDQGPRKELAPEVALLQGTLRAFLGERFLAAGGSRSFLTTLPAGRRLLWDRALLADAVGLAGPYQRFLEETLPRFPPRLRGTIDRIAREQMGRRLGDLVAQAQQARSFEELGAFDLELAVSREVEDLEQAAPLLAQLEELFSDLSLEPYRRDLTRVLAEQGDRLLADVDRLLDRYRLYLPATASLGAWEGQAPVAFAAFGVADEAGLERYLARQRGRIRELAFELAGPALTALAQARPTAYGRAHDRYDRWQRIAQELQVEGPESSVAALEEFIRGELQVTGVGECLARTAAVPTPIDLPRDFFLARREELRALLWQRCDHLAGIRAAAAWAEITELFRARLEERFPFSAAVAGRAGGREAASPEAVRVFLERVDRHRPLLATVPPGHPVFRGAGTQVRDFLADTAELAAFLAPYLAAKTDPALPAAGIEVEFRADRDRERGGNQILGWELALGTQRVSARDPEHRGVWRFGNPLELSLRWAKDAPALPLAAAGPGSGAAVESPAVRYAYADPWALVSFLRSHLAGRPAAPGDPFTLSFAVHTASPGASRAVVEPPSKADVRVFLRVRLFHPETQEPLPWPCFPRTVPSLGPPPPGAGSHWWCHGS